MPKRCKMLMLLSGARFLVPKLFWTIFSSDPKMDLGSSSCILGVEEGGELGEPKGFFATLLVGGLTEGVLAPAMPAVVMVDAKNLLRSAIEEVTAEDEAGETIGGVELFSIVGPTHCLMWSTKRCMSILSPHFSQAMRPAGSEGLT